MTRFSSAVAISILGLSFAHGCSKEPEEDDDDGGPTTTTSNTGITGGTSGMGGTGSGGTSSSTGGTGGGTAVSLAEACPNLEGLGECGMSGLASEPQPVNMLIVLDKSGSMTHETDGIEKWGAMKSALDSALNEVSDRINFGLELFPTPHNRNDEIHVTGCGEVGNCCEMPTHGDMNVPITVGDSGVQAITDTLDITDPGGGTPTARALERALDYFEGAGSSLEGDKYVLLATDGGPNCNDLLECGATLCTGNLDNRDCTAFPNNNCCDMSGAGCVDSANVVDRIEALADKGIHTFVVGIPGSEAYEEFLDDFAVAGKRPLSGDNKYYRVEDVNSLTDVFREITVSLVNTCEFKAPDSNSTEPPDVIIKDTKDSACRAVPRTGSGAGGGGGGGNEDEENWSYDADSRTVTLLGEECERVKQGVERIDVAFDCSLIF